MVAEVIDRVLVVRLARQDDLELGQRIGSRHETVFRGQRMVGGDEHEISRFRAADRHVELGVRLLVDQLVRSRVRAQLVPIDLVRKEILRSYIICCNCNTTKLAETQWLCNNC